MTGISNDFLLPTDSVTKSPEGNLSQIQETQQRQSLSQDCWAGMSILRAPGAAQLDNAAAKLGFPDVSFFSNDEASSGARTTPASETEQTSPRPAQSRPETPGPDSSTQTQPRTKPESRTNGQPESHADAGNKNSASFQKQVMADEEQLHKDTTVLHQEKDPSKATIAQVRQASGEVQEAAKTQSVQELEKATKSLSKVELDDDDGGSGHGGGGNGGGGGGNEGGGGGSTVSGLGSDATTFGPAALGTGTEGTSGYYVSADATGTGNGTKANPYTLQQAQQAMETGDTKTAYLEGGTYNLSSALSLSSKDSGQSWISIGGTSNPVVFDGGGKLNSLVDIDNANNVSIKGVEFENTSSTPVWGSKWGTTAQNSGAIFAENSTGDNFSDNSFNNVNAAINEQNVSDSNITGNSITNAQTAIYMGANSSDQYGSDNTISSNYIDDITSGGPKLFENYGAVTMDGVSNTTISNNLIDHIYGVGIQGTYSTTGSGFTIANNTIENTDYGATTAQADTSSNPEGDNGAIHIIEGPTRDVDLNGLIENNYISDFGVNRADKGVYLDNNTSGVTVDYNYIAGTAGDDIQVHGGGDNQIASNYLQVSPTVKGVLYQTYHNGTMTGNSFTDNWFSGTGGQAYALEGTTSADNPQYSGNEYSQGVNSSPDKNGTTNSDLTLAEWEQLVLGF